MICRLAISWIAFRLISNNAESRFVNFDFDFLNISAVWITQNLLRVISKHLNDSANSWSRFDCVKTKFKMHIHNTKIVTTCCQIQIKWRFIALCRFKKSKNCLVVSKYICGPLKAIHGSMHTCNCHFCWQCSTSTLTIGKLMPTSYSTEWNIMTNKHANSTLNFFWCCSQYGPVNNSWSNCTMNYMINIVAIQRKNFAQTATNLIKKNHGLKCIFSCKVTGVLTCSNHNRIKVIVSKFSSLRISAQWIITKNYAIRVPFADSTHICSNCFFRMAPDVGAKTSTHVNAIFVVWAQTILVSGFMTQNIRSIAFLSNSWCSTNCWIRVEKAYSVIHILTDFSIVLCHKRLRIVS